MQPYQKASAEIVRQTAAPFKALGTAATAIGGSAILNKIAPFLSEYLPQDLAIKGLSKIDPRLGKFANKALSSGYEFSDVKNFLGEKIKEGQPKEPPKEERNIIEQYSPELHQFIDQEVKNGRELLQAGALAQNDKRFAKIIDKLSKDHKTPWSNILQSVYGAGQQAQTQQTQQTQASQQQSGQGQQALASILEKINQRLGQ